MRKVAIFLALFFIAVLLVAMPAHAETFVAAGPTVKIVLTEPPCESEKVIKLLPAEFVSEYSAAAVTREGKSLEACWLLVLEEDGVKVFIVDETGDSGTVPAQAFRPGI